MTAMRRGDVWWAQLKKPAGRRPVLLLSRDESYFVRELVVISSITTRIRNIPVEVRLGKREGLPKACVANMDVLATIPKRVLVKHITTLTDAKINEVNSALKFALGLD